MASLTFSFTSGEIVQLARCTDHKPSFSLSLSSSSYFSYTYLIINKQKGSFLVFVTAFCYN